MNFTELGVQPTLVSTLQTLQIIEPTEIQREIIPLARQGTDLVGISKTGSGKTLAFALPILEQVTAQGGLQAMILAPTRELVEQIKQEFQRFARNTPLHITAIYGGVSFEPQIEALKRAHILVATPGRCLDHLNRRNLNPTAIKIVVLDEADRMASMGFIEDVEKILHYVPKQRQTLLFGATISKEVDYLTRHEMQQPQFISLQNQVEEEFLEQCYYDIQDYEKFSLLTHLLQKEDPHLAIVFCSSRRTADIVAKNLRDQKFEADVLHGGMAQSKRLRVIEGFHRGNPPILVSTEVSARGLDIKNVSHVFNYDIPINAEDYIHRVGRTARAGEQGKAISLLAPRDYGLFQAVLSKFPQLDIKTAEKPSFPRVPFNTRMEREHSFHSARHFRGSSPSERPSWKREGGFTGRRSVSSSRPNGSGFRRPRW